DGSVERSARGVRSRRAPPARPLARHESHRSRPRPSRPAGGGHGGVSALARGAATLMTRRAMVGGAIIVAWIAGLAVLIRREYFRPQVERRAEASKRVTPGVVYYGVMQGDQQVGFASSIIDTTGSSITVRDYLVADLPLGGKARRASARTNVTLSRALRMTSFDFELNTEGDPIQASGRTEGDSVLVLAIASGRAKPDTQRIPLTGPILLPTIVPLALALSEPPKVGKHYRLPVFNPASMAPADMGF